MRAQSFSKTGAKKALCNLHVLIRPYHRPPSELGSFFGKAPCNTYIVVTLAQGHHFLFFSLTFLLVSA